MQRQTAWMAMKAPGALVQLRRAPQPSLVEQPRASLFSPKLRDYLASNMLELDYHPPPHPRSAAS